MWSGGRAHTARRRHKFCFCESTPLNVQLHVLFLREHPTTGDTRERGGERVGGEGGRISCGISGGWAAVLSEESIFLVTYSFTSPPQVGVKGHVKMDGSGKIVELDDSEGQFQHARVIGIVPGNRFDPVMRFRIECKVLETTAFPSEPRFLPVDTEYPWEQPFVTIVDTTYSWERHR